MCRFLTFNQIRRNTVFNIFMAYTLFLGRIRSCPEKKGTEAAKRCRSQTLPLGGGAFAFNPPPPPSPPGIGTTMDRPLLILPDPGFLLRKNQIPGQVFN